MTQEQSGLRIPEFTVADRLRKVRELTGLDQEMFGAEIDISRQTVSTYELGSRKPRRIVLRAWALRGGVPLAWIETGHAESPRPDGDEGVVRQEGIEPPTRWLGAHRLGNGLTSVGFARKAA